MTVERVTWTALPNHTTEHGLLKLSLFVSPRLADGLTLEDFPAFANWPQTLAGHEFTVAFDGLAPIEGLVPTTAPDAELWSRIFPPTTPVEQFVFKDHAAKNLHVFPVRPVLRFLEDVYGALAVTTPPELPGLDDPGSPIRRIADLGDIPSRVRRSPSFRAEHAPKEPHEPHAPAPLGHVVVDPAPSPDAQTFLQAYRFYYRPGSRGRRDELPADEPEPYPKAPEHDFHERVALLGDQPELLRRLGLVIELEFADPGVAAQGVVHAHPAGQIVGGPPPPGTRYERDGRFFGARPRHGYRFHRGLLRLSEEFYDLYQVDADGAATKTVDFASTLGRLRDPRRRSHATPTEAGTPSLRSAGFTVSRLRRGDDLLADLDENRKKNDALEHDHDDVEFDLEDVVRGYRLDVLDENAPGGARWRSLHRRHCVHHVADPTGDEPELVVDQRDEGYVKGVAASSERTDHPNPSDDLYLHEAVFGWDGWSLSGPRPGKRIVEPGQGDSDDGSLARYDPAEKNPLAITTATEVEPRSLPRLRFRHRYRLRARAVDLAGNSLPPIEGELGTPQDHVVLGPQPYLRFDPLAAAAVLRRHVDTEGESLEHLVIRSDLGKSAAEYAADPEVIAALQQAGAVHVYRADSQRHLAPPKGSELLAEQHGRLESGFGGSPAAATAALHVALREEGTFLDPAIVDLQTGQKTIAQLGQAVHPAGTPLPARRGDGLPEGAYVLFSGDSLLLPYLPDPLAVGVGVTAYDRAGNERFHVTAPFAGQWPELEPFRLRLSEGPVGAAFENGVLEVRLPQAEELRVRLSSIFDARELETFALWSWAPSKPPALVTAAEEGRHWMLTPFRTLTLTHAVQRPLAEPDSAQIEPSRKLGETFATFHGPVVVDAKSTGRIDVVGAWSEDVDLLTDDAPRTLQKEAVAFGFDIDADEDEAAVTIYRHVQAGWRWCRRCEGLAFGETAAGHCPVGGSHDLTASGNYALSHNDPAPIGELGWRWCSKCQGLAFAADGPGTCPAGGVHSHAASGAYALPAGPAAEGQRGWRRCLKCKGLVFAGPAAGPCPGGGVHDYGAAEYALRLVTTQPQDRVSRHEFGDTKYRRITYRSVATTRYREFFPRPITDEPARLQRVERTVNEAGGTRSELVVDVLSSARPAAPDVVYVVPTFGWERTAEGADEKHVRRGNGVRIYLRRPWFSSGDGELLGVVLRDPVWRMRPGLARARRARETPERRPPVDAAGPLEQAGWTSVRFPFVPVGTGDPLAPYVSDWGSDPVWESPEPRLQPAVWAFPRRVATASGLTLAELPESRTVTVAAHEVFFDTERKLWYCDVDVDLRQTYFPFVRLALARYQPHALPDAHLSRVVMSDFIQLVPERTATLERVGGEALLTVRGTVGSNVVNKIRASRFDLVEPAPSAGTEMWVSLQAHDPAVRGELGWRTVGEPTPVPLAALEGSSARWERQLHLPESAVEDGAHRLLVTETETYLRTDLVAGDPTSARSPADFVRSRIVYADAFELGERSPDL